MKARKLISILLILMVVATTGFTSSPAYASEGTSGTNGDNRTVRNVPSDSTADAITYDTAKFSNDYIKTPNTDAGFFVNTASQKAYKVPTSTGTFTGQASNDISAEMLRDVFGINETFGAGYKFTYDEAGYLSIYKNVEIQSTKGTVDQIYSQLEKFADGDNNTLIDALDSFKASNTLNTLKYEYSNGQITIMQPGTEPADGNNSFKMDFTADDIGAFTSLADGYKFSTNLNWGTNDALALSYEEISIIAKDSNGTYTDNEKALAQKILNQVGTFFAYRTTNLPGITSGDLADLKIRVIDINGTTGIDIIYPSTKTVDKPFPDAGAATPATYENKPVAKAHYNDADFKPATPKYVFTGLNTYGLSYCLPGNSLEWAVTKSTINADFLRAVFPSADEDTTKLLAEMDLNPDRAYKITINSSGYLQITHEEPIPSYEIKWVMDNGNLIETTSVKEGSVPGYTGATPVKEADSQYTYTFDGWTPEITAATGDTEYKAVFLAKKNTYSLVSPSTNSSGLTRKKGSGQEITITVKQDGDIDRSFEDFTGVRMNGTLLEKDKDYNASRGSTVIVVSPDALEKLPVGENTLTVQFAYGEVSVQINVLEADKPVIDSPPTGDSVSPFALLFIMAISAASIAMIIVMRKRKAVQ